jgi:hypothetical protein
LAVVCDPTPRLQEGHISAFTETATTMWHKVGFI